MTDFSSSKVWLITGCSVGLGHSLLEQVLARGDRCVATLRKPSALTDSSSPTALKTQYPPEQLLILELDVTNHAQIDAVFEKTKEHFGRLDVVVNNAGYAVQGEAEGIEDQEARKLMDVLFWGAVDISKKAVTFFREVNPAGHGGHILQITSLGGFFGNPTLAFYSAGKFALEGFTEAISKEMIPSWNINFSIIEPGGFRTQWAGSSMLKTTQHPAYADPKSPTSQRRKFYEDGFRPMGDPDKAALAMIKVAEKENWGGAKPPMRLFLGADAYMLGMKEIKGMEVEATKWKEVSESTTADDATDELEHLRKVIATA